MKRSSLRLLVLILAVLTTAAACTLIAEVDRSKIADEEPDPSGMGGGTGGDSVGGQGGSN